jgi:hypothetical protein
MQHYQMYLAKHSLGAVNTVFSKLPSKLYSVVHTPEDGNT